MSSCLEVIMESKTIFFLCCIIFLLFFERERPSSALEPIEFFLERLRFFWQLDDFLSVFLSSSISLMRIGYGMSYKVIFWRGPSGGVWWNGVWRPPCCTISLSAFKYRLRFCFHTWLVTGLESFSSHNFIRIHSCLVSEKERWLIEVTSYLY